MAVFFVQARKPGTSTPWATLLKLHDQGQARAVAKALCRYPDADTPGVTARAISTTLLQRHDRLKAVRAAEADLARDESWEWHATRTLAAKEAEELARIAAPKGPTGDFQIRGIPLALRDSLNAAARERGLNSSQWVIQAIERQLKEEGNE